MSLIHFTDDSFDTDVLKYDGIVLVDFWAPWCGPCRTLGPTIEELAGEYEGRAKIGKVNIDEEGGLAQKYMIQSIPMVMIFKNGELVNSLPALRPKSDYTEALDQLL